MGILVGRRDGRRGRVALVLSGQARTARNVTCGGVERRRRPGQWSRQYIRRLRVCCRGFHSIGVGGCDELLGGEVMQGNGDIAANAVALVLLVGFFGVVAAVLTGGQVLLAKLQGRELPIHTRATDACARNSIKTTCPQCHQPVAVPLRGAGHTAECLYCHGTFMAPTQGGV